MGQSTFSLLIAFLLAICCIAYGLRNLVPRLARVAGWASGLAASLVFVAMVAVDAFQPELGGFLQDLAMPAPAVRTAAYWAAFGLHVVVGASGAAYCAFRLASSPRETETDAFAKS